MVMSCISQIFFVMDISSTQYTFPEANLHQPVHMFLIIQQ